MKKRMISFLIISSLIFAFIIFYKGLNKSSFYNPKSEIENIPQFFTNSFYSKEEIDSKKIFDKDKFYLFNIWASWCVPCRDEHTILVDLSKNDNVLMIGLNYKDKFNNAEKFLNELGNPYNIILLDRDGKVAIEWGAFGVPESFLIRNNRIVKRFIGPLNKNLLLEIEELIK
ncbi:DsbE family thiol:disulfide interchange protein [Candidatus Pelagibacter sp.]|nr:DsbE family thiol:disulfide interchange protein [Candidatus Pelagibacter sp.]